MRNKYLRFIFFSGVAIGLAALSYALYVYFEPVADIAKQKTDIRLNEGQLLADFEQDPQQAELKYKNKVLEISGTIAKTESDGSHSKIIFDQKGKFVVVASCVEAIQKEAEQLKQNQVVTVKGIYTGFVIIDDMFLIPGEIKIDQCTIVK